MAFSDSTSLEGLVSVGDRSVATIPLPLVAICIISSPTFCSPSFEISADGFFSHTR
jgi:hypothetical protein